MEKGQPRGKYNTEFTAMTPELRLAIELEIEKYRKIRHMKYKDIAAAIGKDTKVFYQTYRAYGFQRVGMIEAVANALGCDIEIKFKPRDDCKL